MTARNSLLTTPPYVVAQALGRLGADLRTARLRRRLTQKDVAEKIGTGVRAVADAEKGKPSTAVAVYVALLWVFDLMGDFAELADSAHDLEGERLSRARDGSRARRAKGLDNDF